MTRPVRGFLTKHGQFFSTKEEAQTYEATTEFHEALKAHLEASGITNIVQDFIMDKVREFVLINKEVVKAYITLIKTVPEPTTNDIRSVLLEPTPAPPQVPTDEDTDDFISAFTDSVGTDDGDGATSGSDEEGGLDGEGEQSLPE